MHLPLNERQRYWGAMAVLVASYWGLYFSVDVLPGQDLPQHLAISRIVMDYARADLRLSEFYVLPTHSEPYFTVYFLMAMLGKWFSLGGALRAVMSAFVLGTFLALHYLVATCHRDGKRALSDPAWPALLASLLVFSPTMTMGFLQFGLCIPLFLVATGALVGWCGDHPRRSDPWVLHLAIVAMTSTHVLAGGMFLGVAALHVLLNRNWRAGSKVVSVATTTAATLVLWNRFGSLGVGKAASFELQEAMRAAFGLEFVNTLLRLTWSDPPTALSYVLWTVFGPYRLGAMPLVAAAFAVTFAVVRRELRGGPRGPNPLKRAAIAFGLVSLLVPWGLYVPSEITFINLRMMTLALGLSLALVSPSAFATARSQLALASLSLFCVAHFAYRTIGFNQEAKSALRLVAQVPPDKVLMSLPFHDRTRHFGKLFRLTHFLPMYHTVRSGGVATQFWAQYVEHLPIAYRSGKRPAHTPDWSPHEFKPEDLRASDYLLLQRATDEDPVAVVRASRDAMEILDRRAERVACEEPWCLYRLTPPTPPEGGR